MLDVALIRERFEALSPHLDERGRRLFAATEAAAAGYGGIAAVSRITGIAASTIGRGLNELAAPTRLEPGRIRRSGGGRKALVVTDRKLLDDLNGLVEPEARGDPMSPLRWTCKSLRRVAAELAALGHRVSHTVVGELLRQQKFSLQANRKTREGDSHPDRDAQFAYINTEVSAALAEGQAVISVDTKKKELVGDFKNAGREWRRQGEPEEVRVHDFLIKELGRAVPYGIYDLASNAGWVSVGITHDTAAFAVQTIRRWWQELGRARYPEATRLVITADGGGSNGYRVRLWKRELQRLADETGIAIEVHHLPPGHPGDQQVEQDRAPSILVHIAKLAGQTVGQLSGHRQSDLGHHHLDRSRGPLRTGRQYISQGRHRPRRRNGRPQYRMRRISRRMELYDPPHQPVRSSG
jgi:hypothetical protein